MKKGIKLLIIICLLNSCNSKKNKTILFHHYSTTASNLDIIQWDLKDTINIFGVLKETVDSKGRVVKLEFLNSSSSLCYLANIITYEYKRDSIIEILYKENKKLLANDCEMYYKSIYHLDSYKFIKKIERFSKYDFSNIDSTEIEKWKKWVPEHRIELPDSNNMLQIDYYYHSFAKMNGKYPVSSNYILDEGHYYYGDEPEKSSIKKGLKNK